ncbi:MAG: MgtC/SapB family protein, partial [Pseudomonadota bacterium]
SRTRLHGWIRDRLTERELHDGLLLAAAALVVLPLLPDRAVDPWGVVNLRLLWWLAVAVMTINALGYVALRTFGARYGLPVAGLAAGFVSSTATHGAMGSRARTEPRLLGAAEAGAALSSIATVVQMLVVLGVTNVTVFRALLLPMLLAGVAAVAWGWVNMRRSLATDGAVDVAPGRAFQWRTALVFTATVTGVLLAAALLTQWLGAAGALFGVIAAGLADTHAAAVTGASLYAGEQLALTTTVLAILGAFSLNAVAKLIVAYTTGGAAFGNRVLPGLALMVAMAWLGAWGVSA